MFHCCLNLIDEMKREEGGGRREEGGGRREEGGGCGSFGSFLTFIIVIFASYVQRRDTDIICPVRIRAPAKQRFNNIAVPVLYCHEQRPDTVIVWKP